MNLLYSGEIGIEKTWSYALFDTEETVQNNNLLSRMLSLADGAVLSLTSVNISDNDMAQLVPNMWLNDGAATVGGVSFMPDSGLAFSPAEFNGTIKLVNGNSLFKTNYYTKLKVSSQAALFFNTNPNGADVGGTIETRIFHNGNVLLRVSSGNFTSTYALFLTTGLVYLCFMGSSGITSLPFGYFIENEAMFNLIASLDAMRLYCVQSAPNFAHGRVLDAAKKPAANCKVLAYQRSSGKLVGQTMSTSDGSYRCPVLAAKGDEIFMVCLDNDTAPDFEARIIDRITV